jgi:hypothetical protein
MTKHVDNERGMAWVRLESAFGTNPKTLELAHRKQWRAIVAYISGLGYSGQQGLDGFIPDNAMHIIHATNKDRDTLIEIGMWLPVEGGYEIHDWHDYQPTSEAVTARKQKAKQAAETRWKRSRANDLRAVK